MALGLYFGTGAAGDGDSLLTAFTSINNMFSTTTKLSGGDLTINDVRVGRGANNIGSNTALGNNALTANTSGINNTAIGNGSAINNQDGFFNTSLGTDSLFTNISGSNNTAIGKGALQNNTSSGNTGIGVGALYSNLIRNNNTALGTTALYFNTAWSGSTGVGYDSNVDGDNQVQLGNTLATPYAYNALNVRSDERDKADIRDTVLGLDFINQLRPVDYKFDYREDYRTTMPTALELDATEEEKDAHKVIMDEWIESCKIDNLTHDGTHIRSRFHHGLIAQEVKEVIDASGVDFGGFQDHKIGGGGDVLSIGYTELIAPMIKAIQELTARINVLEGN